MFLISFRFQTKERTEDCIERTISLSIWLYRHGIFMVFAVIFTHSIKSALDFDFFKLAHS